MQPETDRLTSLDGIRGLAMISVFLNHINTAFINFPAPFSFLSGFLFNSGVMGVSYLFILSGFLMAYIYPTPTSQSSFLQKRYTRIFPLFLTMSLVSLIFFIYPNLNWEVRIGLIIITGLISHFIWIFVKKLGKPKLSQFLFYLFIIFQIFIGIFYAFWIMRHPPIYLYGILPPILRNATIGSVNSTLTLPLGNYIPMLDGVYWSLASEILFYILYPIICAPFIFYLSKKDRKFKILFVLSLFPLFAGADVLSHHILVISMLQLQLFSYFVGGMVLAYMFKRRRKFIDKFSGIFEGKLNILTIIIFFGAIMVGHFIQNSIPKIFNSWFDLLLAIPFTIILAISLNHKTYLYKMLSSKVLAFIGLISYSIYLSHTPILHTVEKVFEPYNLLSNLFLISITAAITIIVSYFLFRMLEKPYFTKSKTKQAPSNAKNYFVPKKKIYLTFSIICIAYLISIFGAFQSDFNFFSTQYSYPSSIIKTNQTPNTINLQNNQIIKMDFVSRDNNLGVITMHITRHGVSFSKSDDNQMTFKIREKGSPNWYAISGYNLSEIGDSLHHSFGFPPITDSKGKTYEIELSQTNINKNQYITINRSNADIRTVYPVSKSSLIKNPIKFADFIQNRILTVFENRLAQYSFLMFLPFLIISLAIFISESRVRIKT